MLSSPRSATSRGSSSPGSPRPARSILAKACPKTILRATLTLNHNEVEALKEFYASVMPCVGTRTIDTATPPADLYWYFPGTRGPSDWELTRKLQSDISKSVGVVGSLLGLYYLIQLPVGNLGTIWRNVDAKSFTPEVRAFRDLTYRSGQERQTRFLHALAQGMGYKMEHDLRNYAYSPWEFGKNDRVGLAEADRKAWQVLGDRARITTDGWIGFLQSAKRDGFPDLNSALDKLVRRAELDEERAKEEVKRLGSPMDEEDIAPFLIKMASKLDVAIHNAEVKRDEAARYSEDESFVHNVLEAGKATLRSAFPRPGLRQRMKSKLSTPSLTLYPFVLIPGSMKSSKNTEAKHADFRLSVSVLSFKRFNNSNDKLSRRAQSPSNIMNEKLASGPIDANASSLRDNGRAVLQSVLNIFNLGAE